MNEEFKYFSSFDEKLTGNLLSFCENVINDSDAYDK